MRKIIMILTLLSVLAFAEEVFAEEPHIVVEAEGVGSDRGAAVQKAQLEAVRRALGMHLAAKTEVRDNGISEKILSYSRGTIEKYEVISSDDTAAAQGRYRVVIRAWVKRDLLRQGLEHVRTNGQRVDFALAPPQPPVEHSTLEKGDAKAAIEAAQALNAAELMRVLLERYPPSGFLQPQLTGQAEIADKDKEQYKYNAAVSFKSDFYYDEFLPELTRLLDQLSSFKKKEFYRGQAAFADLRAIRDSRPVKHADAVSAFVRHAKRADGYDVIVPGRINSFSYVGYKLKDNVKKGVLDVLAAYARKTRSDAVVLLQFFDDSGEEVCNQEYPLVLSCLTNGKVFYPTILTLTERQEQYQDTEWYDAKEKVKRGTLYIPLYLGTSYYNGIECRSVQSNVKGNALQAGVSGSDYLISVDGENIRSKSLDEMFASKKAGDIVSLELIRAGTNHRRIVRVALEPIGETDETRTVRKSRPVTKTRVVASSEESSSHAFTITFEMPHEIFEVVKKTEIKMIDKKDSQQ